MTAGLPTQTVLYIEDEETDALFMRRAFANTAWSLQLQLVGNGRAAINYLTGENGYEDRRMFPLPDLVLLDLNLPEMAGLDVLRWIRSRPEYVWTWVVVFTSSAKDWEREQAINLGADGYLEKPGSGANFAAVVERLSKRWLRASFN